LISSTPLSTDSRYHSKTDLLFARARVLLPSGISERCIGNCIWLLKNSKNIKLTIPKIEFNYLILNNLVASDCKIDTKKAFTLGTRTQ